MSKERKSLFLFFNINSAATFTLYDRKQIAKLSVLANRQAIIMHELLKDSSTEPL